MIWINLLSLVAAIIGAWLGWRSISRRRRPFKFDGAILSWDENPPSVFRYDRLAGVIITFHACSLVLLSFLLLCSVNRAAPSPLSTTFKPPAQQQLIALVRVDDPHIRWLSVTAAIFAAWLAGSILGGIAVFPIVRVCRRPILVHIAPDGVIYGQVFAPWQDVGRLDIDTRHRLLRLFSSSRPHVLSVILHPPSEDILAEAERKIRDLLPLQGLADKTVSHARRWVSALPVFVGILIALAIAGWAYQFTAEWVWFLYGVEITGLMLAGRVLPNL